MSYRCGLSLAAAALVTAGLLGACSESDEPPRDTDPTNGSRGERVPLSGEALAAIEGETWTLTEARIDGGAKPLPDRQLTAQFAETDNGMHLFGTACNSFGAIVTGWPDSITVGDGAWTEMACEESALNEAEAWFFASLPRITAVTVDGNHLIMWGDGVDLVYDPTPTS